MRIHDYYYETRSSVPPPQSIAVIFHAAGRPTIGRGTDNNLVLPDNDRTISRSAGHSVTMTPQGEMPQSHNRGSSSPAWY